MVHTDERRTLIDWGEGSWKTCKTIIAHKDCEIGNHYHKIKHERFYLASGSVYYTLGNDAMQPFAPGDTVDVPPETFHTFWLKKGSVMIGLCSELYDPSDDFKV